MRAADMPPIASDQSSSAMSTAPSSRVNAVRRHLKLEWLRRGSIMFVSLGERHGCASRPCFSVAAVAAHAYPSRAKHKTGCLTSGRPAAPIFRRADRRGVPGKAQAGLGATTIARRVALGWRGSSRRALGERASVAGCPLAGDLTPCRSARRGTGLASIPPAPRRARS